MTENSGTQLRISRKGRNAPGKQLVKTEKPFLVQVIFRSSKYGACSYQICFSITHATRNDLARGVSQRPAKAT